MRLSYEITGYYKRCNLGKPYFIRVSREYYKITIISIEV